MRTRSPVLLAALALTAAPSSTLADAFDRVPVTPVEGLVPTVEPLRGVAFAVDLRALRTDLRDGAVSLPAPDGRMVEFAVEEAPVMAPGLAAAHPGWKSYAGRAVQDPTTTVRISVTALGLHASVIARTRAYAIDPRFRGSTRQAIVYDRRALRAPAGLHVKHDPIGEARTAERVSSAVAAGDEVPLRVYRLALVTPPSYSLTSGADDGLDPAEPGYVERLRTRTTAAKVVLVTRLNQLYEADFGVRLVLAEGTDRTNLVTDDEATGPNGPCGVAPCFTLSQARACGSSGLARNVHVAGMLVGARNYDIGHLAMGTAGGGVAQLGVVGQTDKAQGCTGLSQPIGDFFAVDYVAHEMGHQFGGNHTFNGVNGACLATNRNATGLTTIEPGSGSTVMAYAGICGADDLQAHSDPYFSQSSIEEMGAYIRGAEDTTSSVQRVALIGFDGTDSVTLTYADQSTPPLTRGGTYTAAGVQAAIEALLPEGATVTIAALDDAGFEVTFGGRLAGEPVGLLSASAEGADAFVGEIVQGGPTTRGGREIEPSGNRAPAVTTPARFVIPVRTPFALTAQGTDPDGDALVYLWEQNDHGPPAVGDPLLTNVKHSGPLFRVFGTAARYADPDDAYLYNSPGENLADGTPTRSFPDVAQILADNTNARTGECPQAQPNVRPSSPHVTDCYSELLPTGSWIGGDPAHPGELHFRVTVRDHHPGTGGTAHADTALQVVPGTGPFRVLPPAPGEAAGTTLTARWSEANTNLVLGVTHVKVSLSLDGGKTFPHVLAAETANDGVETLALPPVASSTARLKIEAVGNVFFDVSHEDIAIDAG